VFAGDRGEVAVDDPGREFADPELAQRGNDLFVELISVLAEGGDRAGLPDSDSYQA